MPARRQDFLHERVALRDQVEVVADGYSKWPEKMAYFRALTPFVTRGDARNGPEEWPIPEG